MCPDIKVNILGWSTIHDVESADKRLTGPEHNKIHNYQLDEIRPLAELLGHIGLELIDYATLFADKPFANPHRVEPRVHIRDFAGDARRQVGA